jgi:hypothetical protein
MDNVKNVERHPIKNVITDSLKNNPNGIDERKYTAAPPATVINIEMK